MGTITDYLILYIQRQVQPYRNATGDWLGIHYLAAFLNENGISTRSFGGYAHEVPELLEDIIYSQDVKVIGLSCDYENVGLVEYFCKYIHSRWNLPVIVGGPQAFALDAGFFQRSGALLAICGEGELTSLEVLNALLDDFEWKYIPGIIFEENGHLIRTQPRELIQNLDALPFPNPKYALGTLFRPNIASFLTGRGCPFSCAFCYEGGNTKGVRWRSVENVILEVEQVLQNRPDLHYILFTDDTFTVNAERVRKFCTELKKLLLKYDFTWFCEGHVATLRPYPGLITEMVDAGMSTLQIGIESGHNDILQLYNKHITTTDIEEVVKECYSSGLQELWGNIILGGAMESPERIEDNIKFSEHLFELGPGMMNMDAVYFWPLPGTAITTMPGKYGMKIIDPQSLTSNCDWPVVEYPLLGQEEFCERRAEFMTRIAKKVYELLHTMHPARIWKLLRRNCSSSNFSIWLEIIMGNEHLKKFFCLTECGAAHLLEDFPESQRGQCHPLRTLSPEHFTKQHCLIAAGKPLTLEETRLFRWASGKVTLSEAASQAGLSLETALNLYQGLQQRRLVVFSEY